MPGFDVQLEAMIVVIVAGSISGFASFGFALIAVPPLLLVFDPPIVAAISLMLVILTRWVILIDTWRDIAWPIVLGVLPTAVIGIYAGAHMLKRLDPVYIELLASFVVALTATLMLRGAKIAPATSSLAVPVSGFLSGVLGASVGMTGPPVIVMVSARDYAKNVLRGTLTAIFLLVASIGLVNLAWHDLLLREEVEETLILLPAAITGMFLGRRAARRYSSDQYKQIVLLILIAGGVVGLLEAIHDLI